MLTDSNKGTSATRIYPLSYILIGLTRVQGTRLDLYVNNGS